MQNVFITYTPLRTLWLKFSRLTWLIKVSRYSLKKRKIHDLDFRSVFLDNYRLLKNKKVCYSCKTKSKGFEFLHKSYATAVAMVTMTFQNGGYILVLK